MDKASEVKNLVWKGEVTFEGTPAQFKTFAEALAAQPISIGPGELLTPGRRAGYITPAGFGKVAQEALVQKMESEAARMQMPAIFSGYIRSPHFHVGDQALLVSKEQFKAFLGEVARQTTEDKVEPEADFYTMIKPLVKSE